jgi:hypothetical protein
MCHSQGKGGIKKTASHLHAFLVISLSTKFLAGQMQTMSDKWQMLSGMKEKHSAPIRGSQYYS